MRKVMPCDMAEKPRIGDSLACNNTMMLRASQDLRDIDPVGALPANWVLTSGRRGCKIPDAEGHIGCSRKYDIGGAR